MKNYGKPEEFDQGKFMFFSFFLHFLFNFYQQNGI